MESLNILPKDLYRRMGKERDLEITLGEYNQKVASHESNKSKVFLDAAPEWDTSEAADKLRKDGNDAKASSIHAQRVADQNVERERELRWSAF